MTQSTFQVQPPPTLAQPNLIMRIPWSSITFVLFLAAFAIFILTHVAPAIVEPDDNGYFSQGSILATTGRTTFTPQSDAQYIGMHWLITPQGTYVSRYPPGLPVLIALLYNTLGFRAAPYINPILATLALPGFYLLARRLVAPPFALLAVVVLALNPTFVHHASGCYAHLPVLFCIIWALYLALLWWQSGKLYQAFLLGLILGTIPAIRYADAIMGLAFLVFALTAMFRHKRIYLHYLAALAGAALPITLLLIHNQAIMGAFWKTGYALTNEQTGFSWDYFKQHAVDYVRTANAGGLGLVYALGVLGTAAMICLQQTRRVGLLLALLIVPMFLVYMAYYWGPQANPAMTMRFLVPIFPPLVLAAVWMLAHWTSHLNLASRITVPLALLSLQLLWGTLDLYNGSLQTHYQKQTLAIVTDKIQSVAHPGDVVLASGNLPQHLDFVHLWKVADLNLMRGNTGPGGRGGPGGGAAGRFGNADPNAPSPQQAQKAEIRRDLYPTNAAEREDKFVADIQKWTAGHNIIFVGTEDEMNQLMSTKGPQESMQILAHVKLPEPPALPAPTSGFGTGRSPNARRTQGGGPAGPGGPFPGAGPPAGAAFGARSSWSNAKEIIIAQWLIASP